MKRFFPVLYSLSLYLLLFIPSIPVPLRAEISTTSHTDWVRGSAPSIITFRHFLDSMGVEITYNNKVELIHTGRQKFDAMFADIREAREYIYLEYFNFRNDSIGLALFDLLGQKAAEGVEVKAMFDSFGNESNDSPLRREHLEAIRATGVDVREFDPLRFPWINHAYHRDHRKIVVIDGRVCYAGGMNVADYYIHGRPEYGAWRDMHMRLTGEAVAVYERIFREMWGLPVTTPSSPTPAASGEGGECLRLDSLNDKYISPDASSHQCCNDSMHHLFRNDSLNEHCASPLSSLSVGGGDGSACSGASVPIAVINRIPHRLPKLMRQTYVAAIDAAQRHIQIVNPYPTNVKSVRRAIKRALRRGVRVEIMVSAKSDVPVTPDVVALEMHKLVKHGAEVYYNHEGFHHSKIMMVDSAFCTVGSTNLDARSFLFDYEVNSFILDAATTAELQHIFEQDKQNCTLFQKGDYRRNYNFGHRLTGHFFSLFRGFF